MKVIKRDGRIVEYDSEKISIAIQKANKEVKGEQKASLDDIKGIIDYIEDLDKKLLVGTKFGSDSEMMKYKLI